MDCLRQQRPVSTTTRLRCATSWTWIARVQARVYTGGVAQSLNLARDFPWLTARLSAHVWEKWTVRPSLETSRRGMCYPSKGSAMARCQTRLCSCQRECSASEQLSSWLVKSLCLLTLICPHRQALTVAWWRRKDYSCIAVYDILMQRRSGPRSLNKYLTSFPLVPTRGAAA